MTLKNGTDRSGSSSSNLVAYSRRTKRKHHWHSAAPRRPPPPPTLSLLMPPKPKPKRAAGRSTLDEQQQNAHKENRLNEVGVLGEEEEKAKADDVHRFWRVIIRVGPLKVVHVHVDAEPVGDDNFVEEVAVHEDHDQVVGEDERSQVERLAVLHQRRSQRLDKVHVEDDDGPGLPGAAVEEGVLADARVALHLPKVKEVVL
ncbi:hypothetical protein TYRP_016060 [Tyrophagus putrescentiae]|nr:hypothetical protein TYRP_016060 [Tyrophagus putrescentiae]